jgi:hypothetical protein
VVTVVRAQLLQRQWPAVVIVTPGIFGFVAAAIRACLSVSSWRSYRHYAAAGVTNKA